ncbi:hypothetical protein PLICRDRAFT_121785 [Plicaturopsis crispa FD-325 SS-3]|nr:hypothetical protein PLICRDRAFT_121785 [Plicaturopsis crispa FD-325 SS-3]
MAYAAQENPPPSRPSMSDNSQQGPIPLFDIQLKILSNSYLSFFEERRKIEETYVDSLLRLHQKVKSIDAFLDDRTEKSTARRAWNEVRDNVEREAQARQAFLATLIADVVNPLATMKDTQDRTRKRIKEELKESSVTYNDFAENQLPKLKRTYLKKCQDVEEHKAAAHAAPASPTHPEFHNTPLTNTKSNPNVPSKPIVTSPQPLRPLDRRPSGSAPPARNRSPSSNTAFSDLAHQGKRQLNQLIGFLDKSGTIKDGRGESNALRAVRAKREADEADKEYRKGVHWLETLRLRRAKTLEGAYKSLELFIHESASVIKSVLERYTDNLIATTTTQTQLSGHARAAVDMISPEKDVSVVASQFPRSLASAIPKPILYYNYHVGPCSDLIFGVGLVDYATARGLRDGEIPKIVRICIKEIDDHGLDAEGIYRVSGRHSVVQELQHKIERDENAFEFNPLTDDVYAASSLLKLYLRELPEPLFRYHLQDRLQHTEDRADHVSNNFVLLRAKMRRLPPVHQATLKALVEHLARVCAHTEKNKMDAKNLAIVFGSVIFGEDDMPKPGDLLSVQAWKDSLMEDLIIHANILFDDRALPAAPAGEPTPVYAYGSAHTRVASVPNNPPHRPQTPRSPDDFTPKLPPRPTNSIHPSLRANPTSPTREEFPAMPPIPQENSAADTIRVDTENDARRDLHFNPAVSTSSSSSSPRTPPSAAGSLPDSSTSDAARHAAMGSS